MEGKKSFTAYCDWLTTLEELSDDEAGRLMKHLFRYVNDLSPTAPDRITSLLFTPLKATLKRDLQKWLKRSEVNRKNGTMGGRPVKAKESEQNPIKPNGLLINPKKPVRDSDSDSDSVSVSEKEVLKKEGKRQSRFQPPSILEVENFILEKKYQSIIAERFVNFYASKNWYVGKNKMKDWRAAASGWEARANEKAEQENNRNKVSRFSQLKNNRKS